MAGEQEKKALYLSQELYGKIQARLEKTGFGSIDEYVTFVLEEVLKEENEEDGAFSKQDEEDIKKRLKSLGYLA